MQTKQFLTRSTIFLNNSANLNSDFQYHGYNINVNGVSSSHGMNNEHAIWNHGDIHIENLNVSENVLAHSKGYYGVFLTVNPKDTAMVKYVRSMNTKGHSAIFSVENFQENAKSATLEHAVFYNDSSSRFIFTFLKYGINHYINDAIMLKLKNIVNAVGYFGTSGTFILKKCSTDLCRSFFQSNIKITLCDFGYHCYNNYINCSCYVPPTDIIFYKGTSEV